MYEAAVFYSFGAVLLLSGAVLVNIAPENPYIAKSVMIWQVGHFLSFNTNINESILRSNCWRSQGVKYFRLETANYRSDQPHACLVNR